MWREACRLRRPWPGAVTDGCSRLLVSGRWDDGVDDLLGEFVGAVGGEHVGQREVLEEESGHRQVEHEDGGSVAWEAGVEVEADVGLEVGGTVAVRVAWSCGRRVASRRSSSSAT